MALEGFMKGNEAAAEAAIRAGCRSYYFYPLTPQSEIGEYLIHRMPEVGGTILQSESEVSGIYMVYGAASAGSRTMTSSSGCGISLMMEGLSYSAAAELPMVIIDVMRGGPGLGSMFPSQADYNQVVKGGGHGGYKIPVLGSSSVQELADNVYEAFDIADKYRTPVLVLIDGATGQMMGSVKFPEPKEPLKPAEWALTGCKNRKKNVIITGYGPRVYEHSEILFKKYETMTNELQRCEEVETEDAEIILVAFGLVGRICKTVVKKARAQGLKVGLIRPITLWPFPEKAFESKRGKTIQYLTVEMNGGLMFDDVKLAVDSRKDCHFFKHYAAQIPTVDEIVVRIKEIIQGR
jgi:2-oxoglutarate ferredoxin oxidoreductase subunit alpha